MNKSEINRMVAEKVMGWEIENDEHYWEQRIGCKSLRMIPNFSENISDAWTMEEKVIADKKEEQYVIALMDVLDHDYPDIREENDILMKIAHATPLQRCLAALEAVK